MDKAFKTYLFSLPSLAILLALAIISSLFIGAYELSINEVWTSFFQNQAAPKSYLIQNIRLPRIILAALVGAGLAISGAAIQGLFRNPLGRPNTHRSDQRCDVICCAFHCFDGLRFSHFFGIFPTIFSGYFCFFRRITDDLSRLFFVQ